MVKPLGWLVQPLLASPRDPLEPNPDLVLPRFLAWRRSVLVLVLLLAALTAALETTSRLTTQAPPSFTLLLKLEPESGPAQQTFFGDLADLVWLLSFYAMPVSALLAAAFWTRPRTSRSILLAGWVASFLVPVAIALTPWSWWTIEQPAPEGQFARRFQRLAAGLGWGYYYVVVLSPAVLALVPGLMRACLRVKMLLPEAVLPGWFLVAAAPFNALLLLIVFVALAQLAPSPLLLTGMLLWLAAPLVHLARASVYTQPLTSADEVRSVWRVQTLSWFLVLGSAACLTTYAATWEAFGLRLVGLDPKSSLCRPWDLVRYCLDFSSRSLFVSVLGADLLLRATVSAWRHQQAFRALPVAEEYDRLMGKLDEAVGQ